MLHNLISILLGTILPFFSILNAKETFMRIETFQGREIAPYIQDIVRLCHQMYAEYPYLYDGKDADYESYLEAYADSKEAVICLVFNEERAIGLAIGMPMSETREHYKQPFLEFGQEVNHFFYLGEFVIEPAYRRQGYEEMMCQHIESYARKQGYRAICIWEVDDSFYLAQKPLNYVSNDRLWEKMGFKRQSDLSFIAVWKNVNETQESPHLATYWIKQF